jgi:hypothetical protein
LLATCRWGTSRPAGCSHGPVYTPNRVEVCRLMRVKANVWYTKCTSHSRSQLVIKKHRGIAVEQTRMGFPRTLSGTKDFKFRSWSDLWECHSLIACESLPHGIPSAVLPTLSWRRLKEHNFNPNKLWTDIISSYSFRLLTCESDKLVALSGVSRQFSGRFRRPIPSWLMEGKSYRITCLVRFHMG